MTRESTNFDLCAFATSMGYVDLCVGKFTLTQERERISHVIPLYTSAVFLISESQCDFLASQDNWTTYWFWWFHVFRWEAWLFFGAVVVLFVSLMKIVDSWPEIRASLACSYFNWRCWTWTSENRAEARKIFCDFCLAVFEAFVYKQKTQQSPRNPPRQHSQHARSYYMLKLGLNFFILLTTTLYASNITAKLIAAKEAKVKYESLAAMDYAAEEAAKKKEEPVTRKKEEPVTLCVHQIMLEYLEPYRIPWLKIMNYINYENFDDLLSNKTCQAALLEEEVWRSMRNRPELCDFIDEAKPIFYMPTGAMVSGRAHRALEGFRFAPSEASSLLNSSETPQDLCPRGSAFSVCKGEEGMPWWTFVSLFVMAITCAVLGIVHQACQSWAEGPSARPSPVSSPPYSPRWGGSPSRSSIQVPMGWWCHCPDR